MSRLRFALLFLLPTLVLAQPLPPVQTVFIILLENESWSAFKGNPDAPYINHTLLPLASFCEGYQNVPGLHPSLPNYIWLEAGTNFGIFDDNPPAYDHLNGTNHLATLLNNAGVSWKGYMEDISGTVVPLTDNGLYAVRHNPFVYFDDVTGTNDPGYAYGIAHLRPYTELASDLTNNAVARYNFITPNVCNDGHDSCYPIYNPIRQTDTWLSAEVPKILNSQAYQNGGLVLITWDESFDSDTRVGMLLLSPFNRGGYYNTNYYTHSSTLRTVQEVFGVTPLLGDAANATDLSDLFQFGFSSIAHLADSSVQLNAAGVIPGRQYVLQSTSNFTTWANISTNIPSSPKLTLTDSPAPAALFYRLLQLP